MAFQTTTFRETQMELEWEVSWDGNLDFTPHREDRQFWLTIVQVARQILADGSSRVTGVVVTAYHKQGPHLDDANPGTPASFQLDALGILSEFGTQDIARGTATVPHLTTGGVVHFDTYQLSTSRLAGSPGVTIKLKAMHAGPQAVTDSGISIGAGGVGGGSSVSSGTPGLDPPRAGTGKKFVFVEDTDSDNGYTWWSGFRRFGEVDVKSVDDMVDHILNDLGEDECIKEIVIIAHGAPGNISVGNGMTGSEPGKQIAGFNPNGWRDALMRLRCKFCEDSVVYLRGCNVGADQAGADLLFTLNQIFQCAGEIKAPTGLCYPDRVLGEDQTSRRGDTAPPEPIPEAPDPATKKKSGGKVMLIAGRRPNQLVEFEPVNILAGRFLPRRTGESLSEELLDSGAALDLPAELVSRLRAELSAVELVDGANAGFSLDGFLQLQVFVDDESEWLPAWGVLGGGKYLSPLREDTGVVYRVPARLRTDWSRFRRKVDC